MEYLLLGDCALFLGLEVEQCIRVSLTTYLRGSDTMPPEAWTHSNAEAIRNKGYVLHLESDRSFEAKERPSCLPKRIHV